MKELNIEELLNNFKTLIELEMPRINSEEEAENIAREKDRIKSGGYGSYYTPEWTKWYEEQKKEHKKFYQKLEDEILKKETKKEKINASDLFLLHQLKYSRPPSDSGINRIYLLGPESLLTMLFSGKDSYYIRSHYKALLEIEKQLNYLKNSRVSFNITYSWEDLIGLDGNDNPEYESKSKEYNNLILDNWYFKHTPNKEYVDSTQSIILNTFKESKKAALEFSVNNHKRGLSIKVNEIKDQAQLNQ